MKYYKFKKIKGGEYPIIRITYKDSWNRHIDRDICKCDSVEGFWVFMDNGQLTHKFEPINTFFNNDDDIYFVNGE